MRSTFRGKSLAMGKRTQSTVRAILTAMALAGLLFTVLSPSASAEEPRRGGTLVIGHTSLRNLNPAVQSGNATGIPG